MDMETQVRQALARGYCTSKNSMKILDSVLIDAMVIEVLRSVGFIPEKPITDLEKYVDNTDPNENEYLGIIG